MRAGEAPVVVHLGHPADGEAVCARDGAVDVSAWRVTCRECRDLAAGVDWAAADRTRASRARDAQAVAAIHYSLARDARHAWGRAAGGTTWEAVAADHQRRGAAWASAARRYQLDEWERTPEGWWR